MITPHAQNNILVDKDLHLKITDFGLAAYAASTTTSVGAIGGSRRWMAPELFDPDVSGVPTFESDVYAFSMTCIEVRCLSSIEMSNLT